LGVCNNDVDLLSRLVEINSDSNLKAGYAECASLVKREAESIGLETEVHDSAGISADRKPRPNLVVRLDAGAPETIVFATHYDVVGAGSGWKHDPFRLTVEGDRAFGRGAADDKGSIVCVISAMRELRSMAPRANVVLLVSPDEEVGGELGVGYLVNKMKIRGDAAIVVDASPEYITIGASGVLWGKVTVKGKQGHAGYPHLAENAIEKAIPFLGQLSKYAKTRERIRSKIPAPPGALHKRIWGRFTLTMLTAGEKENIIPGECQARFDLRVCPDENYETAKKGLTNYFSRVCSESKVNAKLEYTKQDATNYFTQPKHPLVSQLSRAAEKAYGRSIPLGGELGGNDGHYFAKAKIPVVCFGPTRDECNFHGAEEFIYLSDIELVKKAFIRLICDWNADES